MKRAILLAFLSACGTSTDLKDTASDSGSSPGDWMPTEGSYPSTADIAENDCGSHAQLENTFTSSVFSVSAENYGLLFEFIEENLEFDCGLSGTSFECTADVTEDYASWGWAAMIKFEHSFSGSWPAANNFEGVITTDVDCVGSECDGLAEVLEITFPCSTSHSVEGAQE
jgi:hypothetical protein